MSIIGPQGPQGPQGIQGIQGIAGATGATGATGTFAVGDTNTLASITLVTSTSNALDAACMTRNNAVSNRVNTLEGRTNTWNAAVTSVQLENARTNAIATNVTVSAGWSIQTNAITVGSNITNLNVTTGAALTSTITSNSVGNVTMDLQINPSVVVTGGASGISLNGGTVLTTTGNGSALTGITAAQVGALPTNYWTSGLIPNLSNEQGTNGLDLIASQNNSTNNNTAWITQNFGSWALVQTNGLVILEPPNEAVSQQRRYVCNLGAMSNNNFTVTMRSLGVLVPTNATSPSVVFYGISIAGATNAPDYNYRPYIDSGSYLLQIATYPNLTGSGSVPSMLSGVASLSLWSRGAYPVYAPCNLLLQMSYNQTSRSYTYRYAIPVNGQVPTWFVQGVVSNSAPGKPTVAGVWGMCYLINTVTYPTFNELLIRQDP